MTPTGDASKHTKRDALSTPTPGGQMMQGLHSELNETLNGQQTEEAAEASQSILNALAEQQEVSDTVKAGNLTHDSGPSHRSGNSSDSSELQGLAYNNNDPSPLLELFQDPNSGAPKDTIEFQHAPPGAMDFRAALLAEQQQQEEILRERQRRFDQLQQQQQQEATGRPTTPTLSPQSSSSQQSPTSKSSLPPTGILKAPQILNNPGPPSPQARPTSPPSRPNAVTNQNRLSSLKSQPSNAGAHNRTVSWSLDKFEISPTNSESRPMSPPRPSTPTRLAAGSRPRLLSEENAHLSQRLELKDVIGMAPFETEAETNILRAVDEFGLQEEYNRDRTNTESSSLLSNLPTDFTLPPEESGKMQHHKSISELSLGSHDLTPPPPKTTHNNNKNTTINKDQLKNSQHSRPQHRRRRTRTKAHRHTKSVEENLFGLTTQLSKLDLDALKHLKDDDEMDELMDNWEPPQQQQKPPAKEPRPTLDAKQKSHRRVVSSAEKLVERAHTLVTNAMRTSHTTLLSSSSHHRPLSPVADIETPAENVTEQESDENTPTEGPRTDKVDPTLNPPSAGGRSSMSGSKSHQSTASFADDDDASDDGVGVAQSKLQKESDRRRQAKQLLAEGVREDLETFSDFLNPRKSSMWLYCKNVLLFLMIPATAVAAILFYIADNPSATGDDPATEEDETVSISWLILFFGARQVITYTMARATQAIIIDYIALGSRFSLRWMGPVLTLLLVQSKGWPFTLTVWALYNMGLNAGSNSFVKNWGYWQRLINLFNANNPSGNFPNHNLNWILLKLAVGIGVTVGVKRLVVGLFLSRQTFVHYGEELAKVLNSMVLVSEIAGLSRLSPTRHIVNLGSDVATQKSIKTRVSAFIGNGEGDSQASFHVANKELDLPDLNGLTKTTTEKDDTTKEGEPPSVAVRSEYTSSEKMLIMDLLERWEEPEKVNQELDKRATLGAVLSFRRGVELLKRRYPFSPAFGPSFSREMCIESAQNVYDRLLLKNPDSEETLNFDTLAVLAMDEDEIDEEKLKEMIRLFRPDRDGRLSRLAFVKSIDATYKKIRLLSANVHNSSQIDVAIEQLFNVGFYFALGCIVLASFQLNPLQIFLSFSSFVLAFSFMFSSASGKYFEGVLLILVQKPFGIGDRIHVSNSEDEANADGSAGWIVERVNLFSTTVCYGTTNERATIANGVLAGSRIINAARSPNAVLYVNLKFGIDVPYSKIQIFQSAVEAHIKARPREWLAFLGFRASGISVDRGFIEYKVVVQHRDAWQNIISLLDSKARLTSYCLEVAKQLGMRYASPPLPVDLNLLNANGQVPAELQSNPIDSVMKTA